MKTLPIFDVAVIGGGPAGVTAAIASARLGAKTLLVERNGYLGGMLTCAGTGPQMSYHAGKTQVVRGIPDEIVREMVSRGFSPGHMTDFAGYTSSVTPFDAEGLKLVLEGMALKAGVTLLYHTVYTGCETESGGIKSARLFAKGGFFDVRAKVFVDASADADLSHDAGVPTRYGRDGDEVAQPMTMNVKVSNVDRDKVIYYVRKNRDDMLKTIPFGELDIIPRTGIQGAYSRVKLAKERGELGFESGQVLCFETNNPGEFILNMNHVGNKSVLDPFELTEAELEGRRQAHAVVAFMRKYIPGFENCRIVTTGPEIGIRESRRIEAVYELTAEDLVEGTMFHDAVAMGGYPIDVHTSDGKERDKLRSYSKRLDQNSWYSIPYRSLISENVNNLVVAGRCIGATHEACGAVRVTPILMAVAQGSGTAAALAALNNTAVQNVDTDELRRRLIENGAFLEEHA